MNRIWCPSCSREQPVTGHGRCLICGCPCAQANVQTGNMGYLIKRQLMDNGPIVLGILLMIGVIGVQVVTGFGFGWMGMIAVAIVSGGLITFGIKNRYG